MNTIILMTVIFYLLYLLVKIDKSPTLVQRLVLNGVVLSDYRILVLKTWIQKRVGLLNSLNLCRGHGVLFVGSKGLHTIGMSHDIDIVFINQHSKVLSVHREVVAGVKLVKAPLGTSLGLELCSGSVKTLNIKNGDTLEVVL